MLIRRFPALSMFFILFLSATFGVYAQEGQKVLRVADFAGDGIQSGEADALKDLITSYVIELKMFRVIDDSGQEMALKEAETAVQLGQTKDIAPLTADYVLSAKAGKAGSIIVFSMDVTKVSTGEKKSVSDTFTSVNDLILAAKRMTHGLFDKAEAPVAATSAAVSSAPSSSQPSMAAQAGAGQAEAQQASRISSNPTPSLSLVAGTWKGDKNVDRVTITPDGRGYAVLSSGIRMALKAMIDGSTIIIAQNQANSPSFYRPGLDQKSAIAVAKSARPWRWIFSLSLDGKSLSGVKESVFVTVDKGIISTDNNYVRDALWTRLYR